MRRTTKIGKRGALLIVLLLVGSILVGATLFTFYSKTTSTHNVGKLFEIKDNHAGNWSEYREMGDDTISWNPSGLVGGDSEAFNFTIKLSGNSNANRKIYFAITEDLDNGVDLTITQAGVGEVLDEGYVEFTPGAEITFEYRVTLDEYTGSGNYATSVELTKN